MRGRGGGGEEKGEGPSALETATAEASRILASRSPSWLTKPRCVRLLQTPPVSRSPDTARLGSGLRDKLGYVQRNPQLTPLRQQGGLRGQP